MKLFNRYGSECILLKENENAEDILSLCHESNFETEPYKEEEVLIFREPDRKLDISDVPTEARQILFNRMPSPTIGKK